ncbi:hypothetical protein L916_03499 [Phytophthora nicotianae]|uniref:Uncharacterized protein n=1 Tax=Phytophthora nicotianae TaxID=4792 RepID=W2JLP1_PHYNI|nr:hypothetical protein L916_03499 [Phytophthora nicotianae]
MSRSNIRFLGKLFRLTRTKSPLLNDFIRLHLISRSVAAVAADTCASIAEKLVQHFEDQCPRSRAELFKVADKWLLDSTDFDLYGISEALALFELLVMDTAPGVYVNDSGSTLFADFLPRGSEAHRRAYSILMLYSACCGAKLAASEWLPWESSVLRLAETQLGQRGPHGVTIGGDGLERRCAVVRYTNGIKRNGRKFIEKVISQYHIVGVQETKFRDVHHLSKFQFICLQPPTIVYLSVTATAPAMFK